MADLEKPINQTEDMWSMPPVTNSDDDFNIDLSSTEVASNEVSENVIENQVSLETPVVNEVPSESTVQPSLSDEGSNDVSLLGNESTLNSEVVNGSSEVKLEDSPAVNTEVKVPTASWEVILWKFENEMISREPVANETEISSPVKVDVSQPIENSPILQANNQDQEKAKLLQKEKLALLIKEHESKAQAKWFTMWIISGILLTICMAVVAFVLAKDQIMDLINGDTWSSSSVVAVDADESDDEEIEDDELVDDEISEEDALLEDWEEVEDVDDGDAAEGENQDKYIIQVDEILSAWYDNETAAEMLKSLLEKIMKENEEPDIELTQYISQAILNLTVNSLEIDNAESSNDEIDDSVESNDTSIETEENDKWYNINYVGSEEEANWVLPAHCSDLTCYGEDKEFTPCTSFRLTENLDENANRIWSNWICRYKDASELVFIEFK